jgi:hypothetical protein
MWIHSYNNRCFVNLERKNVSPEHRIGSSYQKNYPGHSVLRRGNPKFPVSRGSASANHITFPALVRRNIQLLPFLPSTHLPRTPPRADADPGLSGPSPPNFLAEILAPCRCVRFARRSARIHNTSVGIGREFAAAARLAAANLWNSPQVLVGADLPPPSSRNNSFAVALCRWTRERRFFMEDSSSSDDSNLEELLDDMHTK